MEKDYNIILGIIDNIHDFYIFDKKVMDEDNDIDIDEVEEDLDSNLDEDNKKIFLNIYQNYKKFYLFLLNKEKIDINNEPYNSILFKTFFDNNKDTIINELEDKIDNKYLEKIKNNIINDLPINVNNKKYRELIKYKITTNIVSENKIKLNDINTQIINNFNDIFNIEPITINKIEITIQNINELLSNHQKILLRQPLYYLITENEDMDEIINFFMKYLNLDILAVDVQNIIKTNIKDNIKKFNKVKNINYPLSFLDDTADGLNKLEFRFKIINYDKKNIDQASVDNIETHIVNYYKGKDMRQLYLNNKDNIIVLRIPDTFEKIKYLNSNFYLFDDNINCVIDNINIKVKKNIVGRRTKTNNEFGLFQVCIEIKKILLNVNLKINEINEELKNDINNKFNTYILTFINKIYQQYLQLKDFYIVNYINLKNNIKDLEDYEIIKNKRLPELGKGRYGSLADKIIIFHAYVKNLEIKSDINNYTDYVNIISSIKSIYNQLKKDDYNYIYKYFNINIENYNINNLVVLTKNEYEIIQKFENNNNFYINNVNKELNMNAINYLFYYEIIYNKLYNKINEILDTTELYIQLGNVYNTYYNKVNNNLDLCCGCIIFLLFGAKRYGDWIQAEIAKKNYFILQTTDFYCKMYSYLIKAPVIILDNNKEDIIFNYLPNINIDNKNFMKITNTENIAEKILNNEEVTNNDIQIYNIDPNDKLLYEGLKTVETGIERYYFFKYLKYKFKYYELKNKI